MKYFVAAAAVVASLCLIPPAQAANNLYMPIGALSKPPAGWLGFCIEYAPECDTTPLKARDVVLSGWRLEELNLVNTYVNTTVTPMSDEKHWGFADKRFVLRDVNTGKLVVDRWNYPDDGYGDCEDYALDKRRMLLRAGWPRQALLMTMVLDLEGEGHAVLTVVTNKGDFILDTLRSNIVLWSQTGYHLIERQSQTDPNVWMSLNNESDAPVVSASHRVRVVIYLKH